jgi:hypothetical protein
MTETKPYPSFICFDCGDKYGRRMVNQLCTANILECDICGEHGVVTEPRDFGHLKQWPIPTELTKP